MNERHKCCVLNIQGRIYLNKVRRFNKINNIWFRLKSHLYSLLHNQIEQDTILRVCSSHLSCLNKINVYIG